MLDLVPEHGGQFIFTFHQSEQASADKHMAAGQCEGIDERAIWNVIELIRQPAVRTRRESRAHLLEIGFNFVAFRVGSGQSPEKISLNNFVPCRNFVLVRHAREAHRQAR